MDSSRRGTILSALSAAVGSWTIAARAWGQGAPTPAVTTPVAPTNGGGGATAIAAVVVVVGLLVVIGVAVKLFDLKRKRESESVQLQAQVSDALLREPAFSGLPLTATANVPMWTGTPAAIEVTGQVPSATVKEAALDLVRREAERIRSDVRVEDRISIVPAMARVA